MVKFGAPDRKGSTSLEASCHVVRTRNREEVTVCVTNRETLYLGGVVDQLRVALADDRRAKLLFRPHCRFIDHLCAHRLLYHEVIRGSLGLHVGLVGFSAPVHLLQVAYHFVPDPLPLPRLPLARRAGTASSTLVFAAGGAQVVRCNRIRHLCGLLWQFTRIVEHMLFVRKEEPTLNNKF